MVADIELSISANYGKVRFIYGSMKNSIELRLPMDVAEPLVVKSLNQLSNDVTYFMQDDSPSTKIYKIARKLGEVGALREELGSIELMEVSETFSKITITFHEPEPLVSRTVGNFIGAFIKAIIGNEWFMNAYLDAPYAPYEQRLQLFHEITNDFINQLQKNSSWLDQISQRESSIPYKIQMKLNYRAEKLLKRRLWLYLLIISLEIAAISILIFNGQLKWDMVEPSAFFIGLFISLFTIAYFFITKQNASLQSVYNRMIEEEKRKVYRAYILRREVSRNSSSSA